MTTGYEPTQRQNTNQWHQPEVSLEQPDLLHVGQRLLNRYEIFGVRQGGFGVVYFVTDLDTKKEYAVKTYKPAFADPRVDEERFRAEVDFWINLEPHPNIVKAYFAEVINNQPYLFIEFVNGGTRTNLRDWLRLGPLNFELRYSKM